MTEFSASVRAVLNACARAMASRTDDWNLDLSVINDAFYDDGPDAVVAYLDRCVRLLTSEQLGVRDASRDLFTEQIVGLRLYLAVGPTSMPRGVVTALSPDITLYSAGPYANGFRRMR